MKKADMKAYKEKLIALRARMRGEVSQMANTALQNGGDSAGGVSSMPIHMADLGSDAYEQEFTLSLVQNEEDTLQAIETALEKIEDGVYGACEECGKQIKKSRLNAIPYAAYCINCASQFESGV